MRKKSEKVRHGCGLKASWENSVTWEEHGRRRGAGLSRPGMVRTEYGQRRGRCHLEGWAQAAGMGGSRLLWA